MAVLAAEEVTEAGVDEAEADVDDADVDVGVEKDVDDAVVAVALPVSGKTHPETEQVVESVADDEED